MGKALSLIIAAALICLLMVFQATRTSATMVRLPSELVNQVDGSRIRVAGRVADEKIDYILQPVLLLKFSVIDPAEKDGTSESTDNTFMVPVEYRGAKPDMFAPGRDVILEGEFRNGIIFADQLMTQCPSKYEAPDPATMY